MYIEAYDKSNLNRISEKLKKIPNTKSIEIVESGDNIYEVEIFTSDSIEELAYEMYLHGLSFITSDSKHHIIESSSGV